jgi:ABC-type nitrate/sulfonate/bicarbonate transport system substrate-binding protein
MSLEKIRLLCSAVSHMPLIFTLRDSGVTEKYGFELEVDIAGFDRAGKPPRPMSARASLLLEGEYEFLSGLHHQTYVYRAQGDKRFVYLAQTQNSWDDRLIARSEISELKQLEGKRILNNGNPAPCVMGNLIEALRDAGVDASKIEFVSVEETEVKRYLSLDMVMRAEVDAADVDIPFDLIAKKRGLNVLQLPDRPVIHNTTICASMDFVRRNEDKVIAFLKALIEAIHFFKTERRQVCEILSRELGPLLQLKERDEVEHLHTEWSQLLLAKPYPHPLAIWNVYNLDVANNPNVNFIGPLEIWDTHYLRQIDDDGFIDRLYKVD